MFASVFIGFHDTICTQRSISFKIAEIVFLLLFMSVKQILAKCRRICLFHNLQLIRGTTKLQHGVSLASLV